MNFIRLMRPSHWIKNSFIFAALIFGRKLTGPTGQVLLAVSSALAGFLCFCLASSAVYILNDIVDRNADRLHPQKAKRPIAAGRVPVDVAALFAAALAAVAVCSAYMLATRFAAVIITYITIMIFYSLALKKVMVLDCIIISVGFCLRAVAGAIVVQVFISPWLVICTFALCLFLAFGKRRSEIRQLGSNSTGFRKTLAGYTPELLSHMLDVTSALAVVSFLCYAMDQRTRDLFGTSNLVYTTPFVLYCIFRFSALIQKGKYASPVQFILRDIPFQIGFVLWVLASIAIIYTRGSFGNFWAY